MKRFLEYEKAIGKKSKKLREERNISQETLAHIAGVTQAQISRLESGKHGVTITTLISVAVALGYDPKEFFEINEKLPMNQSFEHKKDKKPVTEYLHRLIVSGKLKRPKRVKEIVSYCLEEFEVELTSSAVSGALDRLVNQGKLEKTPASKGRAFLYSRIR